MSGVVSDVWWCELVCALRVHDWNSRTDCDRVCDEVFELTESQVLSFVDRFVNSIDFLDNLEKVFWRSSASFG